MEGQVVTQVVEQKPKQKPSPRVAAVGATAAERDKAASISPAAVEWAEKLKAALAARDRSEFHIANVAYEYRNFSESDVKACLTSVGLKFATVRSYASARAAYEVWPKWPGLSFTHHRVLAGAYANAATRALAERLGNQAAAESWSLYKLRQALNEMAGKTKAAKTQAKDHIVGVTLKPTTKDAISVLNKLLEYASSQNNEEYEVDWQKIKAVEIALTIVEK